MARRQSGDGQKLVVRQRSPRGYDGVERAGGCPLDGKAAGATLRPPTTPSMRRRSRFRWPISPASSSTGTLDNRGNRLLVMRTPGDSLRVRCTRQPRVRPGRNVQVRLSNRTPCPWPRAAEARIKIQLLGNGGKELWSQQADMQAGQAATFALEIPLPGEEGVYDRGHHRREQSELVAGGPSAVELETHDGRAARAIAGARSAAACRARGPIASSRRSWRSIRPIRGGTRNSTNCRNCVAGPGCRGCGKGRWATTACNCGGIRWASWPNWPPTPNRPT